MNPNKNDTCRFKQSAGEIASEQDDEDLAEAEDDIPITSSPETENCEGDDLSIPDFPGDCEDEVPGDAGEGGEGHEAGLSPDIECIESSCDEHVDPSSCPTSQVPRRRLRGKRSISRPDCVVSDPPETVSPQNPLNVPAIIAPTIAKVTKELDISGFAAHSDEKKARRDAARDKKQEAALLAITKRLGFKLPKSVTAQLKNAQTNKNNKKATAKAKTGKGVARTGVRVTNTSIAKKPSKNESEVECSERPETIADIPIRNKTSKQTRVVADIEMGKAC